jgi:N12 class adenine-specific DNA methylase
LNESVKKTEKQVLKVASEEQANLRSVEVKMLDFDWIFQDGNAKTFLGMLAITEYEYLFSTG